LSTFAELYFSYFAGDTFNELENGNLVDHNCLDGAKFNMNGNAILDNEPTCIIYKSSGGNVTNVLPGVIVYPQCSNGDFSNVFICDPLP